MISELPKNANLSKTQSTFKKTGFLFCKIRSLINSDNLSWYEVRIRQTNSNVILYVNGLKYTLAIHNQVVVKKLNLFQCSMNDRQKKREDDRFFLIKKIKSFKYSDWKTVISAFFAAHFIFGYIFQLHRSILCTDE